MISWVFNIFGMTVEATRQGMTYLEKKAKPKLIDVAEGTFLAEKAREMHIAMRQLLQNHSVERQCSDVKRRAREGVKGNIINAHDRDDVVDEITVRLTDAAMADSFYKKWFAH